MFRYPTMMPTRCTGGHWTCAPLSSRLKPRVKGSGVGRNVFEHCAGHCERKPSVLARDSRLTIGIWLVGLFMGAQMQELIHSRERIARLLFLVGVRGREQGFEAVPHTPFKSKAIGQCLEGEAEGRQHLFVVAIREQLFVLVHSRL